MRKRAGKADTEPVLIAGSCGAREYSGIQACKRSRTVAELTSRALAIGGGWTERFETEGGTAADGTVSSTGLEYVSDGYFAALGLRPREGREFEPGERRRGELSALVNSTFVQKHFGGASALGHRLRLLRADNRQSEWRTIVGVVPDTRLRMR